MTIDTVPMTVAVRLADAVRAWLADHDPDGDDPAFDADRAALDGFVMYVGARLQTTLPLDGETA